MESRRLVQKRLFERREFVLGDETLLLVVRDADGLNEVHVPLENITRTRRRRLEAKGRLLAVGVSCAVFAVIGAALHVLGFTFASRYIGVWALGALIFLAWYLVARRDYLLLETEGTASIFFMTDRPSRPVVEAFIDDVLRARDALLARHAREAEKESDGGDEDDERTSDEGPSRLIN